MLVLAAGCGDIQTDYGESSGRVGRRSLNGFGAMRAAYDQAGFKTRDLGRLSDRVKQNDVIVWIPETITPIPSKAGRWFDRWLRTGNKTLVYLVPDSGSEAEYWAHAGRLAPPESRLEYRRRAGQSINDRTTWRLNRVDVASNGWFVVEPLEERVPLVAPQGAWADPITAASAGPSVATGQGGDQGAMDVASEYRIVAYQPDDKSAGGTKPAQPVPPTQPSGPTGPSSEFFWFDSETDVMSADSEFESLLTNEAGDTVVARITSQRWNNSQVIVVAGGSLLTNYAFSRPVNRALADELVLASLPDKTASPAAGFLSTDWTGVRVSERQPGVPKATGMELLTVWPLSLVTIHGLILGLVACLMLLPIFGRPRQTESRRQTEFGDHLDAVAALMNQAGGEEYARRRISEYMRRVRGETSGPWVLPDPPTRKPASATAAVPAGQHESSAKEEAIT